jgi:transposase-like protein
MPAHVGRPDKFTPERRLAILNSIANKIPYELAAQANGICERTLYYWLEQAEKDDEAGIHSEYVQFLQDLKQVEQEKISKLLKSIESKPERWQADAWLLERRWWKFFSPNAALIEFQKQLDRMAKEGIKNVDTLREKAQEITQK